MSLFHLPFPHSPIPSTETLKALSLFAPEGQRHLAKVVSVIHKVWHKAQIFLSSRNENWISNDWSYFNWSIIFNWFILARNSTTSSQAPQSKVVMLHVSKWLPIFQYLFGSGVFQKKVSLIILSALSSVLVSPNIWSISGSFASKCSTSSTS